MDQGPQFLNISWKKMMGTLGLKCNNTAAYHPQANGLVERMHRQLKASLRAVLEDDNWMDPLPAVLLGLGLARRQGPDATALN